MPPDLPNLAGAPRVADPSSLSSDPPPDFPSLSLMVALSLLPRNGQELAQAPWRRRRRPAVSGHLQQDADRRIRTQLLPSPAPASGRRRPRPAGPAGVVLLACIHGSTRSCARGPCLDCLMFVSSAPCALTAAPHPLARSRRDRGAGRAQYRGLPAVASGPSPLQPAEKNSFVDQMPSRPSCRVPSPAPGRPASCAPGPQPRSGPLRR